MSLLSKQDRIYNIKSCSSIINLSQSIIVVIQQKLIFEKNKEKKLKIKKPKTTMFKLPKFQYLIIL